MKVEFERVAGCAGAIGGVLAREGKVLFSAIDAGRLLSYDPASGQTSDFRKYTGRANGLASGPDGTVYAAQTGSRRVVVFHPDGRTTMPAEKLDGKFHNYPADVSVDGSGRVWFTDPYSASPSPGAQVHGRLDHASVLRLQRSARREWQLVRMTYDTTHPYGVQVSADSAELYLTETDPAPSGRREIRAYPIRDDGSLGTPRVLHTFGADARGPHRGGYGMCLSGELLLVCAGDETSGPGALVYCLEPTGRIVASYPVPAAPVACAVLDSALYVTTVDGGLYRGTGIGN
jgi:gluconolactonase